MHAFIICGYGIPKAISQDQNYLTYLHVVFNQMYDQAANTEALIIPCGGPTNCEPPYTGTEADVMGDYLQSLMKRPETQTQTAAWKIVPENKSLSTLENLLFAKKSIDGLYNVDTVSIFCEKTREDRVQILANKIFSQNMTLHPIDFDITKNRYVDPEVLNKKEAMGIKEGLWTLEEPTRLAKHHEFYEKKFAFLRRRQSEGLSHIDAVKEWFEKQDTIARELMPDHPLLQDWNYWKPSSAQMQTQAGLTGVFAWRC